MGVTNKPYLPFLLGLAWLAASGFLGAGQTALAQAVNQSRIDPALSVGNALRTKQLDELHQQLLRAEDETSAQQIEGEIWTIWLYHGNPAVDQLMAKAMAARRESNYAKAINLLDEMIRIAPEYAEAWNQRATIYFFMESYEKSLQDVDQTLKREPRHFGALAGRAVIRLRQGKSGLAIQNILEALKVNPQLRERRLLKALGYEETKT